MDQPATPSKTWHPPAKHIIIRNRVAGHIVGLLTRLFSLTWRLRVEGAQNLPASGLPAAGENAPSRRGTLFAVWHGRLLVSALVTRDRNYTVLISPSADGEIATGLLRTFGWQVRRGSPYASGVGAMRSILRALREGAVVALTVDGPRGPARTASPGAVTLARQAGCAIHPAGVAGDGWRLRSWDRLLVPWPFARVAMVIGEEFHLPPGDSLEAKTTALEQAIERCEARATALVEAERHRGRDRLMFWLYNLILLPFVPAVGLYTLWRRYGQGRSAASLRGQWGHVPADVVQAMQGDGPRLWLHAVSVGETMAARPVARALRSALPHCKIGLSCTTDTGYETAQAAVRAGEADAVWYFPIDWPLPVSRALRAIKPDVFMTMETELWPNFLSLARRRGVKTFWINGRISDNVLRRAPRFAPLWRWMMGNLDAALMRSAHDAQRLRTLPASPPTVEITGDVKLDGVAPSDDKSALRGQWRATLNIAEDAPFWVAGSTHAGEETMVLQAYQNLRPDLPHLRLLIAPRHIERVPEVVALIEQSGLTAARRSAPVPPADDAVIVLDTVGELAAIYAAADVAFVGGSLIVRGGHNMLEPVLHGVPVVFGPHVANFRAAAALTDTACVGTQVPDAAGLEAAARRWLTDSAERAAVRDRSAAALAPHRGASHRVAAIIAAAWHVGDAAS